jgi:hypothetical protein
MKDTYSYQRMERHSDSSLSTLRKLKDVLPDLSVGIVLRQQNLLATTGHFDLFEL